MALTLNSSDVQPADSMEAIQRFVWSSVVEVDLAYTPDQQPEDLSYDASVTSIGSIVLFSVTSSPVTVARPLRLSQHDTDPDIVVGLQRSGTSVVAQHGRTATLHAGEFAIYDTSVPYLHRFDHGMDQQFFRIPRASLALPEVALHRMTAVPLGLGTPLASFVAAYFARLAASAELHGSVEAASVAEPTTELLRALLSSEAADTATNSAALEATLEFRIIDYMTRHLAEPDLTSNRIAAAHHISVRYLYVVLARAGIAPGDWIRTRRLEACRHDLTTTRARTTTIAAIAQSWGFVDAPHFSRMFKSAYGISPRDWRDLPRAA